MICNLCPRKCNALRTEHSGNGFCGMGTTPVVAKIGKHFGEEPCISGTKGSGAIFFSGCTLKCIYCQNYEISTQHKGNPITAKELSEQYKKLEQDGVHNINIVTGDHFIPAIIKSFEIYKPKIPIVYNCSGYTSPKSLSLLDGIVDVYLPDFKYSDNILAEKYSSAPNYVNVATSAIKEMIYQVGTPLFDDDNIIQKGVIVRHLVLPSHTKNSIGVLELIKKFYDKQVLVSLMGQYIPMGQANTINRINRKITYREYEKVKQVLYECDLDGFTQALSSATEEYIPLWDF